MLSNSTSSQLAASFNRAERTATNTTATKSRGDLCARCCAKTAWRPTAALLLNVLCFLSIASSESQMLQGARLLRGQAEAFVLELAVTLDRLPDRRNWGL